MQSASQARRRSLTTASANAPRRFNPRLALQTLLHPPADSIEGFFDVLDRIRDAEAQITFAKIAERGPRQTSDSSFLKQCVRQFFRRPSGSTDVRKNVKGA